MATRYWRGGTGTWTNVSTANWAASSTACKFTASRATTVLTVTAITSGTITVGDSVWHTNGTLIGTITSFGTGAGGTGTYNMDTSGTVTSRAMVSATIGASATTSSDDVIFDADSNVGTASFTVTANTSAVCRDLTASGLAGAMTLTPTLTVAGSWDTPASNFTSSSGAVTFSATSAKTINARGIAFTTPLTFDGVGGSWQLLSDLSASLTANSSLTNGTLDLNNFTLACGRFNSNNANTRVVAFGSTGKIVIADNGTTVVSMATMTGFSFTGTANLELSYAGATGSRTINMGGTTGLTESNVLPIKVTAGTDTVASGLNLGTIDFTGFSGIATGSPTTYGDLIVSATMTMSMATVTCRKTSGTQVITANGTTLGSTSIVVNGVGGTVKFAGATTVSALSLTNGTLDVDGKTITTGSVATLTGTKNITWNGGTIVVTGAGATAFNNNQPTNFTTTAGSGAGTINMTAATAKTFVGGGSSFNAKLNQGGAGTLTITGSNTFSDIDNTVNSTSVLFTAGTTNTFAAGGFHLDDTTISSVTAANHTLTMASGTVNVSNNTISYSQAGGGATWNSYTTNGNVDGGNNSGWIFTFAGGGGGFLPFFL